MSSKNAKKYRRLVIHQQNKQGLKIILNYIDGLIKNPLKLRIIFSWSIIRGKNPFK